jgi:hypothetical protein
VKVAIGKFGCFCIDAHFGGDVPASVHLALRHYARLLESGWRPASFPVFFRDFESECAADSFELPVDSEIQAMVGREARRHGTSVDQIAAHAVFVYLADLESSATAGAL